MPDTTTPLLGLVKPEIGASRDTWGAKTNSNWDALDMRVALAMPLGATIDLAAPTIPPGWLLCDGRAVSRTAYSELFAAIGTYWGVGDAATTFNLPPFSGRGAVSAGTGTDSAGSTVTLTFGQLIGVYNGVLTQANLPNISLVSDGQGNHAHGGAVTGAGTHAHTTDSQGQHSHSGFTYNGGDHAHSGTTDVTGEHVHPYYPMRYGAGNFVQGGSLVQLGQVTEDTGTSEGGAANHFHGVTTNWAGPHTHGIPLDGTHAHNVSVVGDHQHAIYADGTHTHSTWLGGAAAPFAVQSPVLTLYKIIYAGPQAATLLAVASAPAAGADQIAELREELAALRALLTPPRRVPHAPSRGVH